MILVTTTWNSAGTHTIWDKLAERLGREPTDAEAGDEVRRILRCEQTHAPIPHGSEAP